MRMIGRRDSEELPMRLKGTIDAQLNPAKGPMDQKAHSIST